MKERLFIIFALILSIKTYGQKTFKELDKVEIRELSKIFQVGLYEKEGFKFVHDSWGNAFYEKNETPKEAFKKKDTISFVLRELDVNGKFIKDISLKHYNYDGATIYAYYVGLRKFIIVRSRYSFTIVNLSTYEVTETVTPKDGSDELIDAISGNMGRIIVFNEGLNLLAEVADFGLLCYNLRDLLNPIIIERFGGHKTYFFLDQIEEKYYDGIFINRAELKPSFLFRSGLLNKVNDSTVVQILNNQYLGLQYPLSTNTSETVVVNLTEGILVQKEQFETHLNTLNEESELLVVVIDNAWVRDAPTDGNVIMKLPLGTICEIIATDKKQTIRGQSDYWYKIRYNKKVGYIFGSQTSIKQEM